MYTLRMLRKRLRSPLFRCASAFVVLVLVTNVASSQDSHLSETLGELSEFPPVYATPVTFGTDVCQECDGNASCQGCGNCNDCCDCDGFLSRACCMWDGGFDVGVNGSQGSSRDINIIVGFDATRESGLYTTTLGLDYFYDREKFNVTKNRLYMLGTVERDIVDSPWSLFADGWFEYDEFEEFRSRIGMHVGAARLICATDVSTLKGRIGLGTSKKFEGADDEWKPEALLGLHYKRELTKRQKFTLTSDYYQDVGNRESYRVNTRANWEVVVDEEVGLSFRISAFDRYDSMPGPSEPANELDYWMSLHWGF